MSIANATYTRSTSLAASEVRNYPRFFLETVRDDHSSRHHGREIFREEERVEIIMPGNPYTRPIMRVTEEHRQAWPKQYEAFKAGQEIAAEGTPLEAWARVRPKQLHELKALGFRTIEQIAMMDDQAAGRVGTGGQELRRVAKAGVPQRCCPDGSCRAARRGERCQERRDRGSAAKASRARTDNGADRGQQGACGSTAGAAVIAR